MEHIGGMRLKRSGLVSKEKLLEEIKIALDSMVDDFELVQFSGVNLYFHMHNKDGDKLALIASNGKIAIGMDINGIKDSFSLKEEGCTVRPVKDVEREIHEAARAKRMAQDEINAKNREELLARQQKEQADKALLEQFKRFICEEFGVKHINDVASSVGRITTVRGITKYISESQIPSSGFVYRLSLKDQKTGKASGIYLYNDSFQLIHVSN